ncbi:MAG TPA: DUF3826 domain-containing protein, partial [Lacipirellulaceae bacterium]|nr:DUF3826 domain-containing protein [Lacipirellulaceae bacterium]
MRLWQLIGLTWIAIGGGAVRGDDTDAHAAYRRVAIEGAAKIIGALDLSKDDLQQRVHDLVAQWYITLNEIHNDRDAGRRDNEKTNERQLTAHRRFVAQLEATLTADQVNQVKDGLTYGVVPLTYAAYLELLPELTDAQRREILALLLEAREYAMDAGSADEKHAWFGKYKGRINIFLS